MDKKKNRKYRLHFYEYLHRGVYYPIIARNREQAQAWLKEKGISGYKAQEFLFFRGKAWQGHEELTGVIKLI